jgi:ribonuclease HII
MTTLLKIQALIEEVAPIGIIKAHCAKLSNIEEYACVGKLLQSDARKGVQTLGDKLLKKQHLILQEQNRMTMMFQYEQSAGKEGFVRIGGVDEAGRGPLVGPVVAACVVLDQNANWSGIDDSKKLSKEKRLYFYEKIKTESVAWAVGISDHEMIDTINILNATKHAMKMAIEEVKPDYLLIDAVRMDQIQIPQNSIIKGDTLSASIAAASIMAKVTRDMWMDELHKVFPVYDFATNKGYGTASHYEAIKAFGITAFHRRSFLKNIL